MARILVLYSTYDGQTARIAERVASVLQRSGHAARLRAADAVSGDDSAAAGEIAAADAIVVGAAIRYGHHSRELEKLVRAHAPALSGRPNAFFSVCLSAGGPGAKPVAARAYIEDFCRAARWQPGEVASFAGALQYSKYNPFIRFMMRLIVGFAGGETDTSRDYEYTDWAAVERFASSVAARATVPAAA